jgi:hypothetical protein
VNSQPYARPTAPSSHSDALRRVAFRCSLAVVFIDIVVLSALMMVKGSRWREASSWLALVTLLLALSACLLLEQRPSRPRRERSSGRKETPVVVVFGGPCDGKKLRSPRRREIPSQLLLRHPGVRCVRRSRYVRVPGDDMVLLYRYEHVHRISG